MDIGQSALSTIPKAIVNANPSDLYLELDRLLAIAASPDRDRLERLQEDPKGTRAQKAVTLFLVRLVIEFGSEADQKLQQALG